MSADRRQVYLMPGTLHCAAEPTLITTVLGSCIALCLWDRVLGIGGMNHYVLPRAAAGESGPRYGDQANEQLLAALRGLGARMGNVAAKLFGGAAVLLGAGEGASIGHANVDVALAMLDRHRIPLVAQRTGGRRGLQIRFDTATGQVDLRRLAAEAVARGTRRARA